MTPQREPIVTTVQVPVQAELVWRLDSGECRTVTRAELARLGFKHREDLYQRCRAMMQTAGLHDPNTHPGSKSLAYFLDYVIVYDHDPDADAFDDLRQALDHVQEER